MVTSTDIGDLASPSAPPSEDDDREFFRGLLYGGLFGVLAWTALLLLAFS